MIKKILVALDGSEPAEHALTHALDIAEKYSAELQLLTVVAPVVIPFYSVEETPVLVTSDVDAQWENYSERILSEALERVKKEKPELKVSSKLGRGRPADIIVQTAKDEGCDLIVMGSRGLGGLKELLLGSVSDRVADNATCPVLIVK